MESLHQVLSEAGAIFTCFDILGDLWLDSIQRHCKMMSYDVSPQELGDIQMTSG